MSLLDPRIWLVVLLVWGGSSALSFWKGEQYGVHRAEARQAVVEAKRAQSILEQTREAERIATRAADLQQEAINGYIKARNQAVAAQRSTAADLERVRDNLAHLAAAGQPASAASAACGDSERRFSVVAGLLAEGAGLVKEGGERVIKLAAEKAVLQRAGRGQLPVSAP